MLVLRLLVMVLTIICLMDGHAEVSSSTTGMRDGGESPAVKQNEPEVQILDRKKKKKPKPGKKKKPKPGKKKKPNKAKPTPTRPVTTTTTVSTSTLKTTIILTTPTTTTTATTTTTTVSPTTTATSAKITTSTASATTTLSTTTSATTTVATSTSSQPTTSATTADSGAGGECKATNGKPCIFPFKDGEEEYNECKNHGGKYFWCATSVYDSGKYKHWSYCSLDEPCPLQGDGECRASNNKPCVFPFKDGKKEYNECADHGGQYFWCATGTNSDGKYTAWSKCPKDGSCPLPPKSTTPAMTSTATAASTTPLTIGTTAATDQMEEKVLDTLENLVLGESRDDSLQMAHMLDKKLDTIIKDLEGETSKTELSNSDDMPPGSGMLNLTIKRGQDDKVRDGTELGEGLMFVLSTVDSMKSVSRLSGDCCQDCTSKYPDTELAEYWDTLDTCYCYKKLKIDGNEVEPKTRPSSEFTTKACGTSIEDACCETLIISSSGGTAEHQGTRLGTYKKDGEHNNKPVYKQQQGNKILFFSEFDGFEWVVGSSFNSGGGLRSKPGETPVCPNEAKEWEYYMPGTTNTWFVDSTVGVPCEEGISDCRAANKTDCPSEHTFIEGGFTAIPYDGMLDSYHDADTKCDCREFCDDRPTECKAFLFKTCSKGVEPRCILLNVVKPATTTTGLYKNHFAFCKRDMNPSSENDQRISLRQYPQNCPTKNYRPGNSLPTSDTIAYKIGKGTDVFTIEGCAESCGKSDICLGFHFEISNLVHGEGNKYSKCKLVYNRKNGDENIELEEYPIIKWFSCEKGREDDNVSNQRVCKHHRPETSQQVQPVEGKQSRILLHLIEVSRHNNKNDIRPRRLQILQLLNSYADACNEHRAAALTAAQPSGVTPVKADFNSQIGFIAFAPHVSRWSGNDQIDYIKRKFSTLVADNILPANIKQRCIDYFKHIDDTKDILGVDTEVELFPLMKIYLNGFKDEMEAFFYTLNNPCMQQGGPATDNEGCTKRLFQLHSDLTNRPGYKPVGIHVGFKHWFTKAHQSRTGLPCPEMQQNFCTKLDQLKIDFNIANDDQISFHKMKLQKKSACKDDKFLPLYGAVC